MDDSDKVHFSKIIYVYLLFQTPRTFCAANTEDLKFVLSHIQRIYPGSPIFGMGISMGG